MRTLQRGKILLAIFLVLAVGFVVKAVAENGITTLAINPTFDVTIATPTTVDFASMTASDYINRGLDYHSQGNYEQAITEYTKAIKLEPDNAFAYFHRGDAHRARNSYEQAIADYNKVIELVPDYSSVYTQRGDVYNSLGDYEQAIADYT